MTSNKVIVTYERSTCSKSNPLADAYFRAEFHLASACELACVAGVERGRGQGIGRKGKRGGGLGRGGGAPFPFPFLPLPYPPPLFCACHASYV